ncbi:FAD binding domain-containing protein [Mesoterricola sediminis]|uniref:Carbon-monoxide dehydrogenase medium subunit n=1 Tax=Mesoterricola sediminis TaxID=2927980 RepID=A0AA48GYC9_9BACT|nr:xanthine dehydrogenase family protein subunit M [Mesoterricola sediminis]BDU77890.1 carbon-monoxide dehydrogenase medium subunit [Mesoterricola sediminis]
MRSFLPDFQVRVPATLPEALDLLAAEPGAWTPLAGGTDLMVLFNAGRLQARRFLDLSRLFELRGVQDEPGRLTLGALTTFSELREQRVVHQCFPNLVKSARATGALAIQNRGTLGGNIVNASPAADTPPALLAYGAEVELTSPAGARWIPYADFHQGYKRMDLGPAELLTRIRLPKPEGMGYHFYRKVGTRQAQAISKVCLAAYARLEGRVLADLRIGLGAVAPVPARATGTEALLRGRALDALPFEAARDALQADIAPIDDIRASAHFRRVVAGNVLVQMLKELAAVRA